MSAMQTLPIYKGSFLAASKGDWLRSPGLGDKLRTLRSSHSIAKGQDSSKLERRNLCFFENPRKLRKPKNSEAGKSTALKHNQTWFADPAIYPIKRINER